MKKIAFILFGQVKNYNKVQHNQFKKLIQPSLSSFNVDYFLVTTKASSYFSTRQASIEPINSQINYKSINGFFDFTGIVYDDLHDNSVTEDLFNFSNYLVDNFRNNKCRAWGSHSKTSTFNSMKQLYSLDFFLNKFTQRIEEYDAFILARSDLFYTHKLNIPDLSPNQIILPSFGHYRAPGGGSGCNDRFCLITSKEILKFYCGRFSLLKNKPEFYHAEFYLNQTLKRNNITFKTLNNFRFRLLRSNNIITTPSGCGECIHLTNKFYK